MERESITYPSDQEPVVILGLPGPAYLCDDEHLVELIGRAFGRGLRSIRSITKEVRRHGGRAASERLWKLARLYAEENKVPPPSPIPWRWRRARLAPFLLLGCWDDDTRWLIVRALLVHTDQALELAEQRVGRDLRLTTASYDGTRVWVWVPHNGRRVRLPLNVSDIVISAERARSSGVLPSHAPDELSDS